MRKDDSMHPHEKFAYEEINAQQERQLSRIQSKSLFLLSLNLLLYFISFFLFDTLPRYYSYPPFKALIPYLYILIFLGLFIATLYAGRALFVFFRINIAPSPSASFFFSDILARLEPQDIKARLSSLSENDLVDNLIMKTSFTAQKLELKTLNLRKSFYWFFLFVVLPYFSFFFFKILEFLF